MAKFWTRKNENTKKDDTLQAEDFLKRITKMISKSDTSEKPKIENTK